jgi:hypothetical protein
MLRLAASARASESGHFDHINHLPLPTEKNGLQTMGCGASQSSKSATKPELPFRNDQEASHLRMETGPVKLSLSFLVYSTLSFEFGRFFLENDPKLA